MTTGCLIERRHRFFGSDDAQAAQREFLARQRQQCFVARYEQIGAGVAGQFEKFLVILVLAARQRNERLGR